MRVIKWLAYLGSALLLGGLIGWLGWRYVQPRTSHETAVQAARRAATIPLLAHTGTTVRLQDFHGKVVVLLLGYAACPETCTHTLTNLTQAIRRLGQRAEQVQVLLLSTDPEQDTPAALAAYLRPFHPGFLGLTGPPIALKTVANAFGLRYVQAPAQTATTTPPARQPDASLVLLDQRGYLHVFLPADTSAPDIAADLVDLLRGLPS